MYFLTFCDAARPLQFGFQDSGTVAAEGMVGFHDYLLLMLIFIGAIIFELLRHSLVTFSKNSSNSKRDTLTFTHSSYLEIIWTVIPAYALLLIAVPSFTLLYSLDDLIDASLVIRITGHQWYWTYEYTKYTFPNTEYLANKQDSSSVLSDTEYSFTFDSYMKNTSDLKLGQLRLLEVDNRVLLPTKTHIRLLVTADDVLHSWAVPSFGIKVDACPGRVSQASLYIKRSGHYYGQCSEICGFNHGFMPIVIRGVNKGMYILWYIERLHFFLGPDVLKSWNIGIGDLLRYKSKLMGLHPILSDTECMNNAAGDEGTELDERLIPDPNPPRGTAWEVFITNINGVFRPFVGSIRETFASAFRNLMEVPIHIINFTRSTGSILLTNTISGIRSLNTNVVLGTNRAGSFAHSLLFGDTTVLRGTPPIEVPRVVYPPISPKAQESINDVNTMLKNKWNKRPKN